MISKTTLLIQLWKEARTRFANQLSTLSEADLRKTLPPAPNSVWFLIRHIGDVELRFAKNVFKAEDVKVRAKTVIAQRDTRIWTNLDELIEYTKIADLGLSIDKGTNLNYEYSLPNKVFDYVQAQTPLLVSNRKEVAALVTSENIGMVINTYDPKIMANHVQEIFANNDRYLIWKQNILKASEKYSWEMEQSKVNEIFRNLL